MRFYLLIAFLVLASSSFGQSEYSSAQLQGFTDAYLDAKLLKTNHQARLQDLLEKHKVDSNRYRSILHFSLKDNLPELTPNEEAFILDLKKEKRALKIKNQQSLKSFLTSIDYDYDTYVELESKYKTDLKFQRSLKPFFDRSLQRN